LFGYCSGSVIAPKVVLTAGHCVDGFTNWKITAPNASGQKASAASGTTYDWAEHGSETVNPNHHDIGLIFLSTAINLTSYPVLATTGLGNGSSIVNIGRINNGSLSTTNLYVSKSIAVTSGSSSGFPYDYAATDVIQSGDSGGPDEVPGSSPHLIVAVNSGAGGSSEVLARVDLLATWISGQIASHGGTSTGTGTGTGTERERERERERGRERERERERERGRERERERVAAKVAAPTTNTRSRSAHLRAAISRPVGRIGSRGRSPLRASRTTWSSRRRATRRSSCGSQTSSGYSQVANTSGTSVAQRRRPAART